MYYYLILALQVFCIYHTIRHRNAYYWIFVILFLPLIGCVIYIITQVYSKRDTEKIATEITQIINPTKKIKDLEKKLAFSESYQNRVNLADAYLEAGRFSEANLHYQQALDGNTQNDFYVIKKMLKAFYQLGDYRNVVHYAAKIKSHPEFKSSSVQFLYAMALAKQGHISDAEENLDAINVRFSFYEERLAYANFLFSLNKHEKAKAILTALVNEGEHMTKPNKKLYGKTIAEAQKLLSSI